MLASKVVAALREAGYTVERAAVLLMVSGSYMKFGPI